jgi:hypothetical protein
MAIDIKDIELEDRVTVVEDYQNRCRGIDMSGQYIVIGKKDDEEFLAIEHPKGNPYTLDNYSLIYSNYEYCAEYFPTKVFLLKMNIVDKHIKKEKEEINNPPKNNKRDNIIDFFFPRDKLNPKRDPNSPWEFL